MTPPRDRPLAVEITPAGQSAIGALLELWRARGLVRTLLFRELKLRYTQTALGPLWLLLSPLAQICVVGGIFGSVARLDGAGGATPYPVWYFSGLLPWTLMIIALNRANLSLLDFSGWMAGIRFPRLVPLAAGIAGGLVDWLLSLLVLIGALLVFGIRPGPEVVWLPAFTLLAIALGGTLGALTAALTVRFHDVPRLLSYGTQAWFYLTPVLYPPTWAEQAGWGWLYHANPMTWVVDGFRWTLLGPGEGIVGPQALPVWLPPGLAALALLSALVYARAAEEIVDVA